MSQTEKKIYRDLANKLSIAYGSYSIGVTPNHFEKTYHDENLVGDFWYNLAKSLDESLQQSLTDKIGKLSK